MMLNLEESVEFIDNQPRCPCALILDTSGSMAGAPIDALNMGLRAFKDDLMSDNLAKRRVEIAIVEFNSSVRLVQDFITATNFQPPVLKASGLTDMVGGITAALDLIQLRKTKYNQNAVPFYRPWAFLITDGQVDNYQQVVDRIRCDEEAKRVAFFAVGVEGANLQCLNQISVRPPKMLNKLNFKELFLWLSSSMKRVSQSKPGEMVALERGAWEAV
jgi:uncharacterized protein YegL